MATKARKTVAWRYTSRKDSMTKEDRAIAARVARRLGLPSGRVLLRPRFHNPSIEFVKLVGNEWTDEDTAILERLRWRVFCPVSYIHNLNR